MGSSITVDCQECLEEQLRAKMLGKTRLQGRARQLDSADKILKPDVNHYYCNYKECLSEELSPTCEGRPGCQAQSDLDTAELKSYRNPKIRRRLGISIF